MKKLIKPELEGGCTVGGTEVINSDGAFVGNIADTLASGYMYVGNASNVSAEVAMSGDATMTNAGVVTITGSTAAFAVRTTLSVVGLTTLGALTTDDTQGGGASNGPLIKKSLQAGEAYTGTTAGLMVKNYGDDGTETVPSGEFTGLYVSLKGLHTDPGHNTSLISAHVHASNTTVVHAGLWLYGDMTNGVKASGSTLTNMVDLSEATAITNLASLPAAGTAPCGTQTTADYTFTKTVKISVLIGGVQYYLIADTTV